MTSSIQIDTTLDGRVAGTTCLHHAVAQQNPEIARAILRCRPEFVKRREAAGRTALVLLGGLRPITDQTLTCATILLRYGSDVNSKDRNGFSALHRLAAASVAGSFRLAELLLENGALRSQRTDAGKLAVQLSTGSSGVGSSTLTVFLVTHKTSAEKELQDTEAGTSIVRDEVGGRAASRVCTDDAEKSSTAHALPNIVGHRLVLDGVDETDVTRLPSSLTKPALPTRSHQKGLSLPSVALNASAVLRPGDAILINHGLLEGVEGIFRSFKRGRQCMVRLPAYGTDVLVPVGQIVRQSSTTP